MFGTGGFGHLMFWIVQLVTLLILYTGGNTSFNGFPFLANFVAADAFLPRWLTKRGHRLVFSNGIVVLAVLSCALLAGAGANVNALVPFYAIGVFTAFTMAGFGMAKYHHTHREEHWRRKRSSVYHPRPALVVTVHNAPAAGGVTGAIYRVLELIVARTADSVLCVSPDLEERMRAGGARRVGRALVPAPATGTFPRKRARFPAVIQAARRCSPSAGWPPRKASAPCLKPLPAGGICDPSLSWSSSARGRLRPN